MNDIVYTDFIVRRSTATGDLASPNGTLTVDDFTVRHHRPAGPGHHVVGRAAEAAAICQALAARKTVEVSGPCGVGVTTMLQHVAGLMQARGRQVWYLSAGGSPARDILRRLVTIGYETATPTQPSWQLALQLINRLDPVIVLDDLRCPADDLRWLTARLQHLGLVTGVSEARMATGIGRSLRLKGLAPAAAISLLEADLGRRLAAGEVVAANSLAATVDGEPLHLHQVSALVGTGKYSFVQLSSKIGSDVAVLDRLTNAELTPALRRALGLLTMVAGALVPADVVCAVTASVEVRSLLRELGARGLVEQQRDCYGLPVCRPGWSRSQLASAADLGAAMGGLTTWLRNRDQQGVPEGVVEAGLVLLRLAAERREYGAVVRLVKVLELGMLLRGRLQECAVVLRLGVESARRLGDVVAQAHLTHQLGTLELVLGEGTAAEGHLVEAARLHRTVGDAAGQAGSRHNLDLLQPPPSTPSWWERVLDKTAQVAVPLATAVGVVVVTVAVAVGRVIGGGGPGGGQTGSPSALALGHVSILPGEPLSAGVSGPTSVPPASTAATVAPTGAATTGTVTTRTATPGSSAPTAPGSSSGASPSLSTTPTTVAASQVTLSPSGGGPQSVSSPSSPSPLPVKAALTADPTSLFVSDFAPGRKKAGEERFSNPNLVAVTVVGVKLVNTSNSPSGKGPYLVMAKDTCLNQTVEPQGTCIVAVFVAGDVGTVEGTLDVVTDIAGSATVKVSGSMSQG
jgi:hypothetical protein